MTLRAELFFDAQAQLAEGPVWDDRTNELVWVDILRGEIHRTASDGNADRVLMLNESVGCVALAGDGEMVAGTPSGFRLVDEEADHPLLAALPEASPDVRMNDGKCDPAGRFVAGTMAYDEEPGAGSLWSFDGRVIRRLLEGVTISNGLAWSSEGNTMYYVDSSTRSIDSFRYDVVAGEISQRRSYADLAGSDGVPDGIALDVEGTLWTALWGAGEVVGVVDGRVVATVAVPHADLVTSCTFGGPDLRELFITTACDHPQRRHLCSGALYRAHAKVPGHPARRMARPTFVHGTSGK